MERWKLEPLPGFVVKILNFFLGGGARGGLIFPIKNHDIVMTGYILSRILPVPPQIAPPPREQVHRLLFKETYGSRNHVLPSTQRMTTALPAGVRNEDVPTVPVTKHS